MTHLGHRAISTCVVSEAFRHSRDRNGSLLCRDSHLGAGEGGREDSTPRGHLTMSADMFGSHGFGVGRGATGIEWLEAREAARRPAAPRRRRPTAGNALAGQPWYTWHPSPEAARPARFPLCSRVTALFRHLPRRCSPARSAPPSELSSNVTSLGTLP